MSLTLTATNKPIREPLPLHKYSCGHCGIVREKSTGPEPGYCRDCISEARALGWAEPHRKQQKAAA